VRLLSLTHEDFRNSSSTADVGPRLPVEHVYSRTGYGLVGMYRGLPLLMRHLGPGPIEVAHLFGVPLALALALRQHGARVVVHVMTSSSGTTDRLLNGASWALFDRWVDAYAVTSSALVAPLTSRGVRPSKIMVVPAAIDTNTFRPGERLAARQVLGLDPAERIVVYLGRLSPRRFPAAEIAHGLRSAVQPAGAPLRLVALSPGQTYDGSENTAQYLLACSRAAAAELRDIPGVTPDIRFGDLPDASKVAWLQAADAVLLPFAGAEAVEPPLTLLEALACGATLLVTTAANQSKIVQHAYNGYVYERPQQLAELLPTLLAEGSAERSVAGQASATVHSGFSFATTLDATERLWRHIENQSPLGARAVC
jgi:glycosyltransferase involved in cell wall biosynthesis